MTYILPRLFIMNAQDNNMNPNFDYNTMKDVAEGRLVDESKFINPSNTKAGKLTYATLHPQFIDSLSRVDNISKLKGYQRLNWVSSSVKCYFVEYLCSATLRHLNKFLLGEDYNIEVYATGDKAGQVIETEHDVLHVEAAAYNLLMLAALFRQGRTDLDDRLLHLNRE